MTVAVLLGYRLNDDLSMTKILQKRLDIAIELLRIRKIDYLILSGGKANKNVNLSEAEYMYNYLVEQGINPKKLIKEESSLTTKENAYYSSKIAKNLRVTDLIICSSLDHFLDYSYNPLSFFNEFINDCCVKLEIFTMSERRD